MEVLEYNYFMEKENFIDPLENKLKLRGRKFIKSLIDK